jgi:translation initiation factor 2D
VQDLPGKNAGQQVMAQGRQLAAVQTALAERGVPKRWVKVEDLTAGKKK